MTGTQNTGTIASSDNGDVTLNCLSAGRVEVYAPVIAGGSGNITFTTANDYGIPVYADLRSTSGNITITSDYRIEFFNAASISTSGNVTLTALGTYLWQSGTGTIHAGTLTTSAGEKKGTRTFILAWWLFPDTLVRCLGTLAPLLVATCTTR